ncbi:L,D-transpeptidase family protein [Planctomycetota bacterium]|nr:L,D-transpeptidase family protein [Planctomycetota bacterium]
MVLGSQASRDGMSRRYMVSRKRKPSRWPLVLLVLVITGVGGFLVFGGGESTPAEGEAATGEEVAGLYSGNGETYQAPEPVDNNESMLLPTRGEETSQANDPGKVFTLGSDTPNRNPVVPQNVGQVGQQAPQAYQQPPVIRTAERETRMGNAGNLSPVRSKPSPQQLIEGMKLISEGQYVEGRQVLSHLLFEGRSLLSVADAADIRQTLESVNEALIFGEEVHPKDTTMSWYKIKSGDAMSRIGRKYSVPYRYLERLNNVVARKIQAGKKLKVPNGPFHARVMKSDYMIDVYIKDANGAKIFVCSYMVGLGSNNSTPVGNWIIEPGRKVVNPDWPNPRTGEYYGRNDPRNPIGEYWLALKGTDENTSKAQSYGIHGTIEPESIGTQSSMGCIRLGNKDIKELFYMLYEGSSTVQIEP